MTRGGRSPRQRGDRFERQVRAEMEIHGWLVVRGGGSLGSFDLLALRSAMGPGTQVRLVQCKLDGRMSARERARLLGDALKSGADAWMASREPGRAFAIRWTPLPRMEGARRA